MGRRSITRSGGKVTAAHATCSECAAEVVDILNKFDEVTRISLGHIAAAGGHASLGRRISLRVHGHAMRITVRGNGCIQQLYVFCKSDLKPLAQKLAKILKNENFVVNNRVG